MHANVKITIVQIVLSIKSHIIRLHEDYSLIKVVAMVTKFYAPKKNIDSQVLFLGYLCSIVSVL